MGKRFVATYAKEVGIWVTLKHIRNFGLWEIQASAKIVIKKHGLRTRSKEI